MQEQALLREQRGGRYLRNGQQATWCWQGHPLAYCLLSSPMLWGIPLLWDGAGIVRNVQGLLFHYVCNVCTCMYVPVCGYHGWVGKWVL